MFTYQVKVNGKEIPVHETGLGYYTSFFLNGMTQISIIVKEAFDSFTIAPKSFEIHAESKGQEIQFQLDRPRKLALRLNDDWDCPLYLFAEQEKECLVDPEDPDVLYFEAGKLHEAGEIRPRDNQTIYIEAGAVVDGCIIAENIENLKILGFGTLLASRYMNGTRILNCKNVEIRDITLIKGSIEWANRIFCSENVYINNYKVISWGRYSDGIDFLGCKNVLAENMFIRSEDDSVVVKTNKFGFKGNVKNLFFKDAVIWNGHGGNGLEIGYELDAKSVRNIRFENIDMIRTDTPNFYFRCGAMTIHHAGNAKIKNVLYKDIRVESAKQELIHVTTIDDMVEWGRGNGTIEGVVFENISYTGQDAVPSVIRTAENGRISGVTATHLCYQGKQVKQPQDGHFVLENAEIQIR